MSETVRNDVSIESICTVIENTPEKVTKNNCKLQSLTNGDSHTDAQIFNNNNNNELTNVDSSENENSLQSSISENSLKENGNGETSTDINCDSTVDSIRSDQDLKYRKIKKSVSFDPNDEKVLKFISGEPIVDQKNPFKLNGLNGSSLNGTTNKNNKKKTPPPVPAKRSTLSVRKTVTQQLREREREKEKEKERLKNETNNRKSNLSNGSATIVSPDDFITTEEVLRQSKFVKTYIKNPDPYFVYDPTILARLKFEELRELSDRKPIKKLKLTNQTKERLKDIKKKSPLTTINTSKLPFKKCSKPNYPELADIKVKTGTDSDGEFFNPAEVTKNAKKFDERVKKLHIGLEDDLDDIEEPLTKSESSDEVPVTAQNSDDNESNSNNEKSEVSLTTTDGMNTVTVETQPIKGTFTNTIKSKEFQEYLEKKGLTITPKKIPNGAQSIYGNGISHKSTKLQNHISFKAPESVQVSIDTMDTSQNQSKKPSVFQRLLGNSIFTSRRRTTPKETQPSPRTLNDFNAKCKEIGVGINASPLKRVVLERQSYHGRSKASNLLSPSEALDLKTQMERSRRSYTTGGDDISVSISSALTNAEYSDATDAKYTNNNCGMPILRKNDTQTKPLAKPPRRTLSRDRLSNSNNNQQYNRKVVQESLIRPKSLSSHAQSKENIDRARELSAEAVLFRRSLDRASMLPKRSTQQAADRRQMFERSASMDRNEILKRSTNRDLYNRSISACATLKSPVSPSGNSKEEEIFQHFSSQNGPKLTSTPVKNSIPNGVLSPKPSPITPKAINSGIYVDLQEWEKLRSIKERTDKEMYNKLLQQQQQQKQEQQRLATENIYERLPASHVIVHPEPKYGSQENNNFIRCSPQRNTFSGITRNRQAKIIDGKALLAIEQAQEIQVLPINGNKWATDQHLSPTVRCQSALDGVTHGIRNSMRRGYESDTETPTPVIFRRRNVIGGNEASPQQMQEQQQRPQQQRRIGGILTRDEILQKVKEFCRKSINRTPTMQAIYEKQPLGTDLSPVSYVSVETHQRPMSRMYASPQVPQRMHSLPQRFVPIIQTRPELETTNSSPIYAHVIKRSSMQSNQSDFYDLPQSKQIQLQQQHHHQQQQQQQQRPIYLTRDTLPLHETNNLIPVQYVILDSEKITPNQLYEYQKYPSANINHDIYGQQQQHQQGPYTVRMQQLQALPTGTYGGVPTTIVQQQQQQQITRQRLHDGRSTPLILDRSSQQASQIYWTPQHQRLQQHSGLMPVQISPRYTNKQPSYGIIPLTKTTTITPSTTIANETMFVSGNRAVRINHHPQQYYNIPSKVTNNINNINNNNNDSGTLDNKQLIINNVQHVVQQQQQLQYQQKYQQQQQFTDKLKQQQQRNFGITTGKTIAECHAQNHYEWESGSEGSEVQRIMDNNIRQQHETKNEKSGELKTSANILTNLKNKFSRFLRNTQR